MKAASGEFGEMTALGRRTPAAQMPRAAVVVRWAIACAAVAALAPLLILYPPQRLEYLFLFAALAIVSDSVFLVRVSPGSYFSISSTFLFIYFLMAGATAAAAMAALTYFMVWVIHRIRDRVVQTFLFGAFNTGQHVLACLAGGLVAQLVFRYPLLTLPVRHHPVSRLAVFALTYLLASATLTSVAAYARTGFSDVRSYVWPASTLWMAISFLVTIPFAIAVRVAYPVVGGVIITSLSTFVLLGGLALILRLNTNLKYGNDELKVLNSIGSLINASLNQEEIFAIIARESRRVLLWEGFFIARSDQETDSIEMVFFSETGAEVARRKIPRGAGLTGKAIATGELVYYEQGEHERPLEDDQTFGGPRLPKSLVIAPMKFGDEVLGAICVQSFRSDVYGKSQFRLLQTIAAQAAIAVRNAQLFESEMQATKERDEFFSIVTHEIKNPLTSIKGYTELAVDSLSAGDPLQADESLSVIRQEVAKILRLTDDLLDASRMTAGRFSVHMEHFDLGLVASQIARKHAGTSSHPIDVRIQDRLPQIEADPVRINQVVENLVSNAVKYSPDGSPILIELSQNGADLVLSVRDHGEGIPPEKVNLIFERFYRLETGGTAVKGTGLGLFISREIIRAHGGEISVESEPGEGSTFLVRLPIRQPVE